MCFVALPHQTPKRMSFDILFCVAMFYYQFVDFLPNLAILLRAFAFIYLFIYF